jgi:hypothetical protein
MGGSYMIRSGPAVIHVSSERFFVAEHAELVDGAITFTGCLRHRDLTGERYYAPKTLTIHVSRLAQVEWLEART